MFRYGYDENFDGYTIADYIYSKGENFDVVIPAMHKGKPVVAIDYGAFVDSDVCSVTVPRGVKQIGSMAFAGCAKLEEVVLSDTVEYIGSETFFYDDEGNYPALNSFGGGYYAGTADEPLYALIKASDDYDGEFVVPDGTRVIAENAFTRSRVTKVKISATVACVGEFAFFRCDGLRKIVVDEKNAVYRSDGGCLIERDGDILIAGGSDSVIPSGVRKIGEFAFAYTGLERALISDGVTSIGALAFDQCEKLKEVRLPDSLESLDGAAFANCDALRGNEKDGILYLGNEKHPRLAAIAIVNESEKRIIIDTGAKFICSLNGDKSCLEEAVIPNSVIEIGDGAFSNSALKAVTIPDSVKRIGVFAFDHCGKLTSVSFGNGVEEIGACAFSECEALTSVVIPESVKKLGQQAFFACKSLRRVEIGGGIETISGGTFTFCSALSEVVIREGVKRIENAAFSLCNSLAKVTLPSTIVDITGLKGTKAEMIYRGAPEQWQKVKKG